MTSPATAQPLLVISDFDGTLAGLSTEIYDVPVNARALAALTRLAGLPDTTVGVLSGRHLAGLDRVCALREPVIRAGSHGNETSAGEGPTPEEQELLERIDDKLEEILTQDGAFVERKPFQRVAHVAPLAARDEAAAEEVMRQAEAIDAGEARVSRGKNIVEFSVTDVTKGTWIEGMIEKTAPEIAVFLGDDATDEDGFAVLRPEDYGVKVGEGATRAAIRVRDIEEVAEWLTALADDRAEHLDMPKDTPGRFEWVAGGLSSVVLQVTDWSAQTPCEDWSAADVVTHLATWFPQATGTELTLTDDPEENWFALVALVREVLASGSEEQAATVRGTLITDIFLHTWDLARSQGLPAPLDEAFAGKVLAGFLPIADELRASGQFGPAVPVAADATAVHQLLGATGRDPEWGGAGA